MTGVDKGPHRDVSTGSDPQLSDLRRLVRDRDSWGEPLSYVDLLTNPSIQTRVAKLIVRSALKRSRRVGERERHKH
jgi:hypothetical protein